MMGPVSLDIKNVHLGKELRNFLCDATRPYVSKHLYVVGYASSNCHANTIDVDKSVLSTLLLCNAPKVCLLTTEE